MQKVANLQTIKSTNEVKIIERQINDLEELCKKIIEKYQSNELEPITNDCYELQKFCSKLEYLLQFKLKERKTLLSNIKKDYWNVFVDLLETSKTFEDAIKYVKSLNEIKTNLGRGRAFILFCLQYHRLADAIQQAMLDDDKKLNNYYLDTSIWFNLNKKLKIIQTLYDLNDVNFDILSTKSNFELDTSWPTIITSSNSNDNKSLNRIRTLSFTSLNSSITNIENDLYSSTPLEMDDEIFTRLAQKTNERMGLVLDNATNSLIDNIESYSVTQETLEKHENEKFISNEDYEKLKKENEILKEQLNELQVKQEGDLFVIKTLKKLNEQLENRIFELESNDELNKIHSNIKVEKVKGEKKEEEQEKYLSLKESLNKIEMELNNKELEIKIFKDKLSLKEVNENKLNKEIEQLNKELKTLKELLNNKNELIDQLRKNTQSNESSSLIQIKTLNSENDLLKDKIEHLNKQIDAKNVKIEQIEMDNNEIKKRLVKLIKEKADLWQKADKLEYENELKSNAIWQDDSLIHNCMKCNSTFNLLLRKHHCRLCLKIFCYYCCNNWIDFNNTKIRICQQCLQNRETASESTKIEDKTEEDIFTNDSNDDDDPDINFEVRSEKLSKGGQLDEAFTIVSKEDIK